MASEYFTRATTDFGHTGYMRARQHRAATVVLGTSVFFGRSWEQIPLDPFLCSLVWEGDTDRDV